MNKCFFPYVDFFFVPFSFSFSHLRRIKDDNENQATEAQSSGWASLAPTLVNLREDTCYWSVHQSFYIPVELCLCPLEECTVYVRPIYVLLL